jgi:hypothetical protein
MKQVLRGFADKILNVAAAGFAAARGISTGPER